MDFYRFFLPQHNPRLLAVEPRQIELAELEQIASELLKAVERIKTRQVHTGSTTLEPATLTDAISSLQKAVNALAQCSDQVPADSDEQLLDIVRERSNYPGWEHWTALVLEQFASSPAFKALQKQRLEGTPLDREDQMRKKAA